jgi:hypothetical protein
MLPHGIERSENFEAARITTRIANLLSDSWGYLDAAPKVVAHPERLALFLAGAEQEITPVNLEVWPSLTCTARCHSCPYIRNGARKIADKDSESAYVMDLELWQKLAAEFREAGGLSVTFTGGGEPTVNKEIATFAAIARKNGLDWGLYTNGASLTPQLIDNLLEHKPTFIRVSVNSGSAAAHHALYRLGETAYWSVQELVAVLLRRAAGVCTVGLGYIMSTAVRSELIGIREYLVGIERKAGRPVEYIAIRPALKYYDRHGNPVGAQPQADTFGEVPALCREILADACGSIGTRLQINDAAFAAVAGAREPDTCYATQWAASSTNTGDLYLLSEANGGTTEELRRLCYGRVSNGASFAELWRGPDRRQLTQEFSDGVRRAPIWHKLADLDLTLKAIRRTCAVLEPSLAREVSILLAANKKPAHWKFI